MVYIICRREQFLIIRCRWIESPFENINLDQNFCRHLTLRFMQVLIANTGCFFFPVRVGLSWHLYIFIRICNCNSNIYSVSLCGFYGEPREKHATVFIMAALGGEHFLFVYK